MLARRNEALDLLGLASIERLQLVDRLHWLESVSLDSAFSTNPTNSVCTFRFNALSNRTVSSNFFASLPLPFELWIYDLGGARKCSEVLVRDFMAAITSQ